MTDLEQLALRCEGADKGSRELDEAIQWAIGRVGLKQRIKRFTASLDAATSLVPEGLSFEVRSSGIGDKGQALVWDPMTQPGTSGHGQWRARNCATPELALTAAALRARARQTRQPQEGGDAPQQGDVE
jgi:hypothetical protein